MIPEFADRYTMKRVLEALFMNPDKQDILLLAVTERYGLNARPLGRTGTHDPYHYATCFSFQLPAFLSHDDVADLLRRVALDARLTLYRWQINSTQKTEEGTWHSGLVTFFGMTPAGDNRRKYYDPPPDPRPVDRYVMDVAKRLKVRAEAENRRHLVELHGLVA